MCSNQEVPLFCCCAATGLSALQLLSNKQLRQAVDNLVTEVRALANPDPHDPTQARLLDRRLLPGLLVTSPLSVQPPGTPTTLAVACKLQQCLLFAASHALQRCMCQALALRACCMGCRWQGPRYCRIAD